MGFPLLALSLPARRPWGTAHHRRRSPHVGVLQVETVVDAVVLAVERGRVAQRDRLVVERVHHQAGAAIDRPAGRQAVVGFGVFGVERQERLQPLRRAVGEAVVAELAPVQEKFNRYMKDTAYLKECEKIGAERAGRLASRTLQKAMKKVGFIL